MRLVSFLFSGLVLTTKTLLLVLLLMMTPACSLSPQLRHQVEMDLLYSENLVGANATPLHRQIFGDAPLNGKLYRQFFDQRIQSILGEGLGFASCHGAIACNSGKTIRLTDQYEKLNLPPIVRLSILLHEARHSEGWTHEKCPSPLLNPLGEAIISPYQNMKLDGEWACDQQEIGAYGIQIVMLSNIERFCDVCSPQERRDARQFSNFLMNLITSEHARRILQKDYSFSTQPKIDPRKN